MKGQEEHSEGLQTETLLGNTVGECENRPYWIRIALLGR